MKRTVCLLLVLSVVSVAAWAGDEKGGKKKVDKKKGIEPTKAVKILKKVDAACKKVKAVKYDVTCETTGTGEVQRGKIEASYVLAGFTQGGPEKSYVDIKAFTPGSKEFRRIGAGSDGEVFYVIDHQAKMAYEDIDPQVVGSFGSTLMAGMMIEYIHPTPFGDEIRGKSQELKGSKTINGEDCYEIHVVYAVEQAPQATWYFSKKDFLPRGRIDVWTTPDGQKVSRTRMISNLVVDPKLEKGTFMLKLPEGYTKTDDFAP